MSGNSFFGFDESEVLSPSAAQHVGDFKVIRRLHLPSTINAVEATNIKIGLVVDVEATGLSAEHDEVVQLAMLPFTYDAESGLVLEVLKNEAFNSLREASVPMSTDASIITGILDDDLTGMEIDAAKVEHLVNKADLITAHNAAYDRPMVEKLWPCFESKPWACTFTGVNWLHEGMTAGKLEFLGLQFGWFYDGHDALSDCEACLALLTQVLPGSQKIVLNAVRENAFQPQYLVRALGAAFEKKDLLKQRHYKWRASDPRFGKFWWTITSDLERETKWLHENVYGHEREISASIVPADVRFSDRLWELN
tara:strand:+ start:23 stop:949 length:927 start_codon:yes stop_codon:yes gene_type:complete